MESRKVEQLWECDIEHLKTVKRVMNHYFTTEMEDFQDREMRELQWKRSQFLLSNGIGRIGRFSWNRALYIIEQRLDHKAVERGDL